MRVDETYGVILLLANGEPLVIKESKKFDECKALFDQIEADWIKSRKTKGEVFKLRSPFIFSCDPQFILRVSLVPKKIPKAANSQNPYQRRMEEVGFEAMRVAAPKLKGELTDEGYTTED
jgi:hypothetical protein